jgi:hypothetical protein
LCLEFEILLQKFLEENALSAKRKKAHASCAMALELGAAVPRASPTYFLNSLFKSLIRKSFE